MIKKIILTLLAMVLATIIFTACGSKDQSVTVTNEVFGDISITADKDAIVKYSDKNGSLDVMGSYYFTLQNAHISSEKFDIILGYASYKNGKEINTYEKKKADTDKYGIIKDVTFGSANGYLHVVNGVVFMFFPAKTDDAARIIAVFSQESAGKVDGASMSNDAARELFETAEVQNMLSTLKF